MDNASFEADKPEEEKPDDQSQPQEEQQAQAGGTVRSLPPNYEDVLKTTPLPPYVEGHGAPGTGVWHTAAWLDPSEVPRPPPPPSYDGTPFKGVVVMTGMQIAPGGMQAAAIRRNRTRKLCCCIVLTVAIFITMAAIGVGFGVSKWMTGSLNQYYTTPAPPVYAPGPVGPQAPPANAINYTGCGTTPIAGMQANATSAYVLNGQQAAAGAWPWFVSIIYTDPYHGIQIICGGSLLSNHWVLTSASCASNYINVQWIAVYAGSVYFPSIPDTNRQTLQADRVVLNPNYVSNIQAGVINSDVALIHLSTPAYYTPTVVPVCLPTPNVNLQAFKVCVAMGFGATTLLGGVIGIPSQYLIQGQMQPITNNACQQLVPQITGIKWNVTSYNFNYFFCAGSNSPSSAICKGDGGGPLVCQNQQNVWTVVGVSSFAVGNCQLGIFSTVSTYLPWMNVVMGP